MSSTRQSPTPWATQEDIELTEEQELLLDVVIDELASWRSSQHLRKGSVIRIQRTVGEELEPIKIKFEAHSRDEMRVRISRSGACGSLLHVAFDPLVARQAVVLEFDEPPF